MFPVIRSRSGPSHILAAVETLSPPLTAVPFWKGTARSYRAFFRAHRLIVAAFGHPNPGDISLAYWPRHLENNIWGVVKGQVELQVRLDRELPDLPRKIGMAARQLLAAALMARRGFPVPAEAARSIAETRTAAALLSACQTLQAALDDCWANVGTANICAGLFVRLR